LSNPRNPKAKLIKLDIMTSLKSLETEINKINTRNRRVEADKAWETSKVRRILLTVFTYLAIAIYLNYVGVQNAWLNALVPAIAFMLSTFTIPFFKRLWLKYFYK